MSLPKPAPVKASPIATGGTAALAPGAIACATAAHRYTTDASNKATEAKNANGQETSMEPVGSARWNTSARIAARIKDLRQAPPAHRLHGEGAVANAPGG